MSRILKGTVQNSVPSYYLREIGLQANRHSLPHACGASWFEPRRSMVSWPTPYTPNSRPPPTIDTTRIWLTSCLQTGASARVSNALIQRPGKRHVNRPLSFSPQSPLGNSLTKQLYQKSGSRVLRKSRECRIARGSSSPSFEKQSVVVLL